MINSTQQQEMVLLSAEHSAAATLCCTTYTANYTLSITLLCCHVLQWLKNQTDAKLADLFESIRAMNFRRTMAISYIYNSMPRAMKGNAVIFALQRLQVEDLERFASMPLWEPRYQNLTNVTLIDLASEIYTFGESQVRLQRSLC